MPCIASFVYFIEISKDYTLNDLHPEHHIKMCDACIRLEEEEEYTGNANKLQHRYNIPKWEWNKIPHSMTSFRSHTFGSRAADYYKGNFQKKTYTRQLYREIDVKITAAKLYGNIDNVNR
jgi:hypothetical protein